MEFIREGTSFFFEIPQVRIVRPCARLNQEVLQDRHGLSSDHWRRLSSSAWKRLTGTQPYEAGKLYLDSNWSIARVVMQSDPVKSLFTVLMDHQDDELTYPIELFDFRVSSNEFVN